MPEISIILPSYNSKEFIEKCILTINNQEFKDFELIIINDGSTDESPQLILSLLKSLPNAIFHTQENKGPSFARNEGIRLAKGKYIVFIDSDDWIEPEYLIKLWEGIQNNQLACMGYVDHSEYGRQEICEFISAEKADVIKTICKGTGGVLWNKIFLRDILIENGIFFNPNISMCEDLDFILRYMKYVESVLVIPFCYYHYNRILPDSLSKRISIEKFNDQLEVLTRIEHYLKELLVFQKDRKEIMVHGLESFLVSLFTASIPFEKCNKVIKTSLVIRYSLYCRGASYNKIFFFVFKYIHPFVAYKYCQLLNKIRRINIY